MEKNDKQYCRYCAWCVSGNGLWCEELEKELTEGYIRHNNNCKKFTLSELGDVDTGRQYHPKTKPARKDLEGQIRMEEILNG